MSSHHPDVPDKAYVGRQIAGVNKRLDELQRQAAVDAITQVGIPIIDNTYTPTFSQGKKGRIFVSLKFAAFGNADDIKVVMVNPDEIIVEADYFEKRIKAHLADGIDNNARQAQSIVSRLDEALDPLTTYHVIRLVAMAEGQDGAANPDDVTGPPVFADYPGNVLFTFTTPEQASAANAPSKPTTARIVANEADPDFEGLNSVVTLRIFADETEALTFEAQGTVAVQPNVREVASGDKAPSPPTSIDDPTDTFVDVSIGGLITGRLYEWIRNTAYDFDNIGVDAPSTSPVQFIAGGFADPSDGLANLTLVDATAEATEDPGWILITFELNQPNPAYKAKNYTAKRKISDKPDSDYDLAKNLVVDRDSLRDPSYSTPGSIFITFGMSVKPSRTYLVKLIFRAIGGFSKEFISDPIDAAALSVSARETAASGGLSLIDGGALIASVKDYDDLESPPGAGGDADFPGRKWETATNSGTPINNRATGVGGSTLDSDGVRWMTADKRLLLATNIVTLGGTPSVRFGKTFRANDRAVICALFLADTAPVTVDISFAMVDQGSGDIVVITATNFEAPNTEPSRYFGILEVPGSYVGTGKQWMELRLGSNPAHILYTWNWHLDWGVFYRDFKVNTNEQNVLDFINATPTSAGSGSGDFSTYDDEGNVYSPGGTQAGRIVFL